MSNQDKSNDPKPETDTIEGTAVGDGDIIPVETIDQFAGMVGAWHKRKVSTLEHMLTIPPGTQVSVGDGADQLLEGDLLKGYLLGLTVAISEIRTLPFVVELEDDVPAVKH
jgi:hypothetical protein